jgi:tellurium resistance protein TerD
MGISLQKGQNVSVSREAGGSLQKVLVGLGWDPRASAGADFDLDASAFMVTKDGKVRSDADFVFYGQLKSADGSVQSMGDNRTGGGDGDDEQLTVDLGAVSQDVSTIVFVVTIYDYDKRKQNFGQVSNCFIRIVNADNDKELMRFDLGEDFSVESAVVFGELYRHQQDWKFRAVGQGYQGGLMALCQRYGVNVG